MFKHALKDIYIGKNSRQLLDPSDVEFSFYSYGRHIDEDGEIVDCLRNDQNQGYGGILESNQYIVKGD